MNELVGRVSGGLADLTELKDSVDSFLKPPVVSTDVPQTAEVEGVGKVVLTDDHEAGPLLKENLMHELEVKRIALERLQAEIREAERLAGVAPND